MPVFQIGLDDGRTLKIEADNHEAALAGAQHFISNTDKPSTGYVDAAKQGVANLEGGVGETLNQLGLEGLGGKLQEAAKNTAPDNYAPAQVVSDQGVTPSALPRAVVENAPGIAASIAAARLTPGGVIPKLLAGSGMYALQTFGNRAKARAENNGDETPTTKDKLEAAASLVPETAIGAVGLGRYLPGAGAVRDVGTRGVAAAVKQLAKTAMIEGATTGAQNVAAQAGATLGTNKGLSINPTEAENAAAIGAGAAAPFAGPKAVRDIGDAVKYRDFGGNNKDAVASVANDIQAKAGGEDALNPGYFNAKTKQGFDAVSRAEADNKIELQRQIKALPGALPADAQDALSRAVAGQHMTEGDHDAITQATQGLTNGDVIQMLARKAGVFPMLKDMGDYNEASGKFSGGINTKLLKMVREHSGKTALAAIIGGAAEGSHLIAYSPEMLAAAGAGGILSRLAAQKLTGNLNPANRFVRRFANPDVQTPVAPALAQQQPQPFGVPKIPATAGAQMRATGIGPWGAVREPEVNQTPGQIKDVADLMAARRANAALLSKQAAPLLAKLANSNAAHIFPIMAGVVGGHLAGGIGEHLAHSAANSALEAYRAKLEAMGQQAAAPAQTGPAPIPSAILPASIASPAKKLMASLQAQQKLKQKILGQNQADEVASGSQLIDRVGGPEAVANPEAGKRMAAMVSAANAIKKLEADLGPLPGRVNGAAATVTGMPTRLPLEKRTPGGTDQQWPPKNIGKANGRTAVDNEPFPVSSYAHLPAHDAANAIAKAAEQAGNVKYKAGFRSSTLARIQGERMAMELVGREVPGLPMKEITARLEGVPDQKTATAFREHLKAKYPQASKSLDTYLSDDVIKRLWRRKG